MVSAGVKELLRSRLANGVKSNFVHWHSAGEVINRLRVPPSVGAVPSSPWGWRERALGQPAGSSLMAVRQSLAQLPETVLGCRQGREASQGQREHAGARQGQPKCSGEPVWMPRQHQPPMPNQVSAIGEMPIQSHHSREHSDAALRQDNDFKG